jgi:ActR/RegA family two-component response regulator
LVTTGRLEREILILASDAQLRIAMVRALSSQGYQRLFAVSISEALTKTVDATPILCVLCLDKNGGDIGIDVVEQLRQVSPEVNFVVIAENATQAAELSIPDQGDFQVLSRPFLMLEFVAAIERTF